MSEDIARDADPWGRVLLSPSGLAEAIYAGVDVATVPVSAMDEAVVAYNTVCTRFDKLKHMIGLAQPLAHTPDEEHAARSSTWHLPEPHASLDVRAYVLSLCDRDVERIRVEQEMDLFEERGLIPVLRACVWLVEHFRANGIVWGVGRGSSVASYVLFLIGVHRIDSIFYRLDIREFLK